MQQRGRYVTLRTHPNSNLGKETVTRSSMNLSVARSPSKRSRRSAYWTLTATSMPSCVTARWTWASEAAPTGVRSNVWKTSFGPLPPNSCRTVRSTSSHPRGYAQSCSTRSSSMYASGRMLLRDPMVWPNLMYSPPLRSAVSAMRFPARSWHRCIRSLGAPDQCSRRKKHTL